MKQKKSIFACLKEIKQREISELKGKLMLCEDMEYRFDKNQPYVCVSDPKPHDVRIQVASIKDGNVCLLGFDEECGQDINVNLGDVSYGQIELIAEAMPIRTFFQEAFVISRLSREDLDSIGFDSSDVDDKTMQRLAEKLGEDYCEQLFWTSLEIIAEERFNIPRKNSEDDDNEK